MNKLKIILTILTIAIMVVPIAIELAIYKDNLIGLIIPPELTNMMNSGGGHNSNGNSVTNDNYPDFINPDFEMPQQVGEPTYDPATKTVSFTFNITDPVEKPVTVDTFSAGIVSHDDGVFLGNLTISKPITLLPGQTADITALGILSDDAINYLKIHAENQIPINIDLTNLNVDVGGITIQLDSQNIGDITVPPGIFG
jgi:hypothetical protein